jgi:hypothetical protein
MIADIAARVYALRNDYSPKQIAAQLTEAGLPITVAEVRFILTWAKHQARVDAIDQRKRRRERQRKREARADAAKRKREQDRLAKMNMNVRQLRTWERAGCKLDRRGRMRLPELEGTQ